ncbi:LiaI-LiaF-like domain-containing protein [Bacillus dakarensis]|uniref:LiaI-LiaF-like domain-containing protein n=1 Tax=Robertmurraya dakarensis TaxID=1926278 RepID=UPI000982673F|nr:DUF5668 domain-containing protein [Bacillus dakarensis]
MKNQRIFPGFLLLGFGIYFLLQELQVSLFEGFGTWPTLSIIVGVGFLLQGYLAKDNEAIIPGTILTGFGLHVHFVNILEVWPDHTGIFILIIALGFLLRYQKVRTGFFPGFLFLALALLLLFYDKTFGWISSLQIGIELFWKFWPIIFIGLGAKFLFFKKK